MSHILNIIPLTAGLTLITVVALSFLGRVLPLGDSFAVFRLVLLALLIVMAILIKHELFSKITLVLAVFTIATDSWHRYKVGHTSEGTYRVYQKNIKFDLQDATPLVEDMLDSEADFITLQEVTDTNAHILEALKPAYPYQHYCVHTDIRRPAVLSKFPFVENSEICDLGLAAVKVQTPDQPIWVASLHLQWPWPYRQSEQMQIIEPALKSLTGPIIIAGDFNAVPWSHTVIKIGHIFNGQRAGSIKPTFDLPTLPMKVTIDHIIAGRHKFRTRTRPKLGSDHFGVLSDVSPAKGAEI